MCEETARNDMYAETAQNDMYEETALEKTYTTKSRIILKLFLCSKKHPFRDDSVMATHAYIYMCVCVCVRVCVCVCLCVPVCMCVLFRHVTTTFKL